MAKEKQLNFAVAIIAQPEHEQANNETHAAVDASKEPERPAW